MAAAPLTDGNEWAMLADYNIEGTQIWLADSSLSATGGNVCVREQNSSGAIGGVVSLNAGNLTGLLPQVGTSSDLSPCTVPINDLDAPAYLHVDASAPGSTPQSACVSAGPSGPVVGERVFAGPGPGAQPVSFTPDPGTP